jgi:hypothetical protein
VCSLIATLIASNDKDLELMNSARYRYPYWLADVCADWSGTHGLLRGLP